MVKHRAPVGVAGGGKLLPLAIVPTSVDRWDWRGLAKCLILLVERNGIERSTS